MLQKTSEHKGKLKLDLAARLKKLPADQQRLLKNAVITHSKVCTSTWYNTLSGERENLRIIIALSNILNCKLDDVVNPDYAFSNPNLTADAPDPATVLGLSQVA